MTLPVNATPDFIEGYNRALEDVIDLAHNDWTDNDWEFAQAARDALYKRR